MAEQELAQAGRDRAGDLRGLAARIGGEAGEHLTFPRGQRVAHQPLGGAADLVEPRREFARERVPHRVAASQQRMVLRTVDKRHEITRDRAARRDQERHAAEKDLGPVAGRADEGCGDLVPRLRICLEAQLEPAEAVAERADVEHGAEIAAKPDMLRGTDKRDRGGVVEHDPVLVIADEDAFVEVLQDRLEPGLLVARLRRLRLGEAADLAAGLAQRLDKGGAFAGEALEPARIGNFERQVTSTGFANQPQAAGEPLGRGGGEPVMGGKQHSRRDQSRCGAGKAGQPDRFGRDEAGCSPNRTACHGRGARSDECESVRHVAVAADRAASPVCFWASLARSGPGGP